MSRSTRREITVAGVKYYWALEGNAITGHEGAAHHIRVHSEGLTKCLLYIDPTPWHFEIRPKMIAQAIDFARSHGWEPRDAAEGMYISMRDGQFYVLPKGVKFAHQDKK